MDLDTEKGFDNSAVACHSGTYENKDPRSEENDRRSIEKDRRDARSGRQRQNENGSRRLRENCRGSYGLTHRAG